MKKKLRLGHIKLGLLEFSGPVQAGEMELERVLDNLVIFWIEEPTGEQGWFLFMWATEFNPDGDSSCGKYLCTLDEWERIEAAVKEYNETEF